MCKTDATMLAMAASYQLRSPNKNWMTDVLPIGSISVVILIRTDTTLDLSQKAEKVYGFLAHANQNQGFYKQACMRFM